MSAVLAYDGLPHTDQWHATRASGIGGSDASTILGLNRWKSAHTLWAEKTGQVEPARATASEAAYWGTALEGILTSELESRLRIADDGLYIRSAPGTYRSEQYPYMLANVDGLAYHEEQGNDPVAGVEIKTVGLTGAKEWDGPDDIAVHAIIQCHHYMTVLDLPRFYLGCLIAGQKFVWRDLERDDDLCELIIERERQFWHHVTTGTPPPVDGSASTRDTLARRFPKAIPDSTVDLDGDLALLLGERRTLTEQVKAVKARIDEIDNALKNAMGDAEAALIGQDIAARWTNVTSTRIDTTRLKAEHPDLAAKYATTSTSRRFVVP